MLDPRAIRCRNFLSLSLVLVSGCGLVAFAIHAAFVSHKPPTGDKGLAGATGATGATGAMGATGAAGVRGVTGNPGATGTTGAPGPPGAQGPAGHSCWDIHHTDSMCNLTMEDANHDGRCTPADCLGPQGVLGPTGPHGPTGPAGATGAAGGIRCWDSSGIATACNVSLFDRNGDGACDVNDCAAVVCDPHNNVTACVGPTGLAGVTGPRGPTGPTGAASSTTGPTGATGSACWDRNRNGVFDVATEDIDGDGQASSRDCVGPNGINGPNGPNGVNGFNGGMGAVGPTGPTGATGSEGARGASSKMCWDLNGNGVCDDSTEDSDWNLTRNGCNIDDCVTGGGRGAKRRYTLTQTFCAVNWFNTKVVQNQTYVIEYQTPSILVISATFTYRWNLTTTNRIDNPASFVIGGQSCTADSTCSVDRYMAPYSCGTGNWPADVVPGNDYPQAYFCYPRITQVNSGGNITMWLTATFNYYGVPIGAWRVGFYSTSYSNAVGVTVPFDFVAQLECTMWISRQLTP